MNRELHLLVKEIRANYLSTVKALGLKDNEIRYLAKILSIADVYDAMTSSRPYRKTPLTMEEAIMQIQMGKGTQFDSEIADVLIDLLTNSKIAYG